MKSYCFLSVAQWHSKSPSAPVLLSHYDNATIQRQWVRVCIQDILGLITDLFEAVYTKNTSFRMIQFSDIPFCGKKVLVIFLEQVCFKNRISGINRNA